MGDKLYQMSLGVRYLIFAESRHYGWNASYITFKEAKTILKMQDIDPVYIFKITGERSLLKFKYPLSEYYSFLQINHYENEVDMYLMTTMTNPDLCDFREYIEIDENGEEITLIFKEIKKL
jgi:hypothetical protein